MKLGEFTISEADARRWHVKVLRQFLSDCRAWLDADLKAAIAAAIAAIEGQKDDD